MKILQVNCVYKTGSTGKIVSDIHMGLIKNGIDSVICYGRGKTLDEAYVYKTCSELYANINHFRSYITGIMYGGCILSTKKLEHIILKERPDVVHLHCINGYFVNIYEIVQWLKIHRIKTVLTLHAEFMYTGGCGYSIACNQWSYHTGCGYSEKCPRWRAETGSWFFDRTAAMWKKMKMAFEAFDEDLIVTSVSPWLMERAEQSPILEGKKHCAILNGLDTELFHPYDTTDLKKRHKLKDEKVIFHVTPMFRVSSADNKGGYYVIELAKRMKDENVTFIVAGSYEKGIEVPDNVILLGRVTNQELLAQYYSMADLTILTSRSETFSMVTAESQCCGTPVVGFKAGGPEQIALPENSEFIEYGEMKRLEDAVFRMLDKGKDTLWVDEAQRKFDKRQMVTRYIEVYRELLSGGKISL